MPKYVPDFGFLGNNYALESIQIHIPVVNV